MLFIFAANFSAPWTLPLGSTAPIAPLPPIPSYTTGSLHFVAFHLAFYLQLCFVFSQNRTLPDTLYHCSKSPQYELVLLVTCSLKINKYIGPSFLCACQSTFDMAYEVGASLSIRNVQNLTPLTLAAKLARIEMFFHILNIEREIYWQIGKRTDGKHKVIAVATRHRILYKDSRTLAFENSHQIQNSQQIVNNPALYSGDFRFKFCYFVIFVNPSRTHLPISFTIKHPQILLRFSIMKHMYVKKYVK